MTSALKKRTVDETDIAALRTLLQSEGTCILTPSDEGYAESIKRWSRAAEKPAGVAVVPSTAREISITVKYATEQNIDLAVVCGGHSTAGVSSTDGGLLIDLGRKMHNVEVDVPKKQLKVQGGCNWGHVDQAGAEHGLATVGGTVVDTGVGGLILGGGYGWLSGLRGLVIDVLVEVTMVLSNGEIVKASDKENSDLFWALKGAGQNFGVVTEFVLQAYDQPPAWAGMLVFPPVPEVVSKVVEAANELFSPNTAAYEKLRARAAGGILVSKPPGGDQVMLVMAVIFFGTAAEGKQIYQKFYDIGPVADTTAEVPYTAVNNLLGVPYGLRASLKGAAYKLPLRPAFVQQVLHEVSEFVGESADYSNSMVMWEMFDALKVSTNEGGSFANRGWHLNGMISPMWTNPESDAKCRAWARKVNELFKKEIEKQGKEAGVGSRGKKGAVLLYGNYDQYDEKARDIFGDNYSRLQSLKGKYDPTNAFNKLFAITV